MQSIQNQLNSYREKGRRFRKWKKVVTALACVVVFCTVYALILPAITLEGSTYCDKEEHTHTDDCYKAALVTIEEKLVCTKEEVEPHRHTDDCYEIRQVEVQVEETVEVPVEEESQDVPDAETGNAAAETEEDIAETGETAAETEEAAVETEEVAAETGETTAETEEAAAETKEAVQAPAPRSVEAPVEEPPVPQTKTITVTKTEIQEEKVLVCETEETEETEGHLHGDGCYEEVEVYGEPELTCGKEEHKHSKVCYSNPDADVETAADWEKTFEDVTFTNDWVEDALAIAKTQLGYSESTENYIVLENGDTKGYTRYGEWYSDRYGDWCAMFVSFCLDYAKVEDFPLEAGCQNWILKIKGLEEASKDKDGVVQYNAWQEADDDYIPARGNIIFFNWDAEADSDHVGIVVGTTTDEDGNTIVTTVEGNTSDTVRYKEYNLGNNTIMGYGILPDQGYYCEMTGHAHDEDCYNDADELICEVEEHIHTEECEEQKDREQPDENADKVVLEDETATEYTEACVTKHWTEGVPEGVAVEVQLYANDEPVGETIQLSEENGWTHKWSELEKYSETETPVEYSIQEISMEGYYSNTEKIAAETSTVQVWKIATKLQAENQYMLVGNAGAMQEIDGSISWVYAHPEDISLCSQDMIWTAQATEGGEIVLYNNASGYAVNVDDEQNNADETLTNIDLADYTIYRLVEKEVPEAEFNFILTNTKVRESSGDSEETESIDVTVTKQWTGRLDTIYPESVMVQLKQNDQEYDRAVELNVENEWAMTWSQLPKTDEEGNEFVYTVEETELDNYTPTQEITTDDNGNQNIVLTNTWAPEKVVVELHKVDFGNTSKFLAGAEFDIYQVTNGAEGEDFIPDTEGVKGILKESIAVNEEGMALLELDADETYYLVETRSPNGYNALIEPIGFAVEKEDELTVLTLLNSEKWAEVTSGTNPVLMVKNSNGYLLPRVGGSGITTYITAGLLMMISAVCLMYTKKKRRGSRI